LGVFRQFDALIEELTMLELLMLFARLKGMSTFQAHGDADQVIKLLEVSARSSNHLPNNGHIQREKILLHCQPVREPEAKAQCRVGVNLPNIFLNVHIFTHRLCGSTKSVILDEP
jgi:hypothetical protein